MTHKGSLITGAAISLFFAWALPCTSARAQEIRSVATSPRPDAVSVAAKALAEHAGIWKWAVPPTKMNGMFDDHDPIGLVAGKLIPADCSFNWTDPDTHKLYCFTSATSLVYFLDSPQTYIAEAEKTWRALQGNSSNAR
jgi:hypothetical protein